MRRHFIGSSKTTYITISLHESMTTQNISPQRLEQVTQIKTSIQAAALQTLMQWTLLWSCPASKRPFKNLLSQKLPRHSYKYIPANKKLFRNKNSKPLSPQRTQSNTRLQSDITERIPKASRRTHSWKYTLQMHIDKQNLQQPNQQQTKKQQKLNHNKTTHHKKHVQS